MLKTLSNDDARGLFKSAKVARLGCIVNGEPYVVPITFLLEDNYLYSHSLKGMKITALRETPRACVQVDAIESEALVSAKFFSPRRTTLTRFRTIATAHPLPNSGVVFKRRTVEEARYSHAMGTRISALSYGPFPHHSTTHIIQTQPSSSLNAVKEYNRTNTRSG